eukprot:765112-Hanusia_phi.AAC.6
MSPSSPFLSLVLSLRIVAPTFMISTLVPVADRIVHARASCPDGRVPILLSMGGGVVAPPPSAITDALAACMANNRSQRDITKCAAGGCGPGPTVYFKFRSSLSRAGSPKVRPGDRLTSTVPAAARRPVTVTPRAGPGVVPYGPVTVTAPAVARRGPGAEGPAPGAAGRAGAQSSEGNPVTRTGTRDRTGPVMTVTGPYRSTGPSDQSRG